MSKRRPWLRVWARVAAAPSAAVLVLLTTTAPAAPAVAPALAATTTSSWTIDPGGSVTLSASATVLRDTATGKALRCGSSTASGALESGTGLSGKAAASLTASPLAGCSWTGGIAAGLTPTHLPWTLNLVSYSNGVTTATMTGIHADLSGPDCTAEVDGTSATADDGTVQVSYTNSTGKLKLLTSGGNLHIYDASDCAGLINNGDGITASTAYTVSPGQTIQGFASTAWSITPGGQIKAALLGIMYIEDLTTNNFLSCTSSSATATLKSGSALAGAGAGSITAISFSNCTGPLDFAYTLTPSHLPWALNLVSYSSGVTTATITGIHAHLLGPSCTAVLDGTSGTADDGALRVSYTNSTGKLKLLASGGNLRVYNGSGCAGLINTGDKMALPASYSVSPRQAITAHGGAASAPAPLIQATKAPPVPGSDLSGGS
jgi:hypothetical protein